MSVYGGPDIVTNGLVLHLDAGNEKSYPRVNGPELVTNSLVTVAGDGQIFNVLRNASQSLILFPLGTGITGRTYQITWVVTAQRATTSATLRNGATYSLNINRAPGTYSATFTATATGAFGIFGDNTGTDFDLDYVSIKEIINSDGAMLYDLSGNNNHGTLINGPTFNSSNNGRIVFDGTNDYIDFPSLSSFFSNGEASLVCFLNTYTSGPNTGANSAIFGFGSSFRSHYTWSDGLAYFNTFRNNRIGPITLSSVNRSMPHMLSITTKTGGNWILYQNLQSITSVAAQNNIDIATPRIGNGDDTTYNFRGNFYCFLLYNRELSITELSTNYNALKGRFAL